MGRCHYCKMQEGERVLHNEMIGYHRVCEECYSMMNSGD